MDLRNNLKSGKKSCSANGCSFVSVDNSNGVIVVRCITGFIYLFIRANIADKNGCVVSNVRLSVVLITLTRVSLGLPHVLVIISIGG